VASKRAFREAIWIAKLLGSTITVIHVVPVVVEGLFDELSVPEKMIEYGKELLQEAAQKGEQAGVAIKVLPLAMGVPEEAIVGVAKDMKFDICIMGSHGRKGLERLTLGSVCEYVIRHSGVPVMCLRGVNDNKLDLKTVEMKIPMKKILFPFDNSEICKMALKKLAIPVANASGSELHFRYQIESHSQASVEKEKIAAEAFLEEASKEAKEALTLHNNKIFCSVVVSNGHVADSLSAAANDFDLVIMATAGRRGLARLFMGSITESVLRCCNTPILTYHPITK